MADYQAASVTYDPAQFITPSVLQRRCDQRSRAVLPPCFSASLRHCRPVCLCSQLCGGTSDAQVRGVCLRSAQVLRYVVTPPATSLAYILRHFELHVFRRG